MTRMANGVPFDVAHTALVAMDCQAGIVSIYAKPPEEFVERASGVLRAARKVGVPIIHVQAGFRSGLPEVSSRNRLFAGIKVHASSSFSCSFTKRSFGMGQAPRINLKPSCSHRPENETADVR